MKITGELTVRAPQEAVFNAVQDARFFASCIDGVQELNEIDPTHYDAVLETKVAYMKFRFKLSIEVTKKEPPSTLEAKVEGTPLGIVGRITATSLTRLSQIGDETKIEYEIEAAITGKLGSLGQPVLRSKAKEMEKQFSGRLREKFEQAPSEVTP
ncbi:MAG TPA: SRPBCC domain-containing protein [Pseudolabrys sp.]|jgi:carbon monoxide dehydrogenase subunit G